ncbi:MAG: hypothetical protein Q8942_16235 [Bacillota bacterium]|nr:hypothetical protein [Bacillota bacterium]
MNYSREKQARQVIYKEDAPKMESIHFLWSNQEAIKIADME